MPLIPSRNYRAWGPLDPRRRIDFDCMAYTNKAWVCIMRLWVFKAITLIYNCEEGDVVGVMERPSGESEEAHAEQDKWFVSYE
jgi:hypothetical protein